MTHRERFRRIFSYEPVDRMPVYFFGSWCETKTRWQNEGFTGEMDLDSDRGPQLDGMDPDWEGDLWSAHGLVRLGALGDRKRSVLSEKDGARVLSDEVGRVFLESTNGTAVSHTITYPLEPTRKSWDRFMPYLDPTDPRRYPDDLQAKANVLNGRDVVTTFMAGSLYNWLRDFMGVEQLSYLMYDDPVLLEDMLRCLTDHFKAVTEPMLRVTRFDFAYFFEDCCGSNGPLFSPSIYRSIFDKYYRELIDFYKRHGVPYALIDSDGQTEPLISCWLESGFDILFPVEVGKWAADPASLRDKFGKPLRMLGGVDKHLLAGPEAVLRNHLLDRKHTADAGGYIPIPDHRIAPEVSYAQMRRYIRIFREVFPQA